jgi:hypothetical protein
VHRYRRPTAAIALTLSLAGVTVAASACSLASPQVITTPYAASDGTNADLPVEAGGTVQFRNFLLVSAALNAPGVLVGAVTTDSVQQVPVQITVLGPDGETPLGQATTVNAQPGQLTTFGAPDSTARLQVPDVEVPPGSVLTLSVASASGTTSFSLPVVAPVAPYDTITPSAVPTSRTSAPAAPTVTPTRSPQAGTAKPSTSPAAG